MQAHRHAVILLSLLFVGLLACAHAGKVPAPDPPQPPPTLDVYGGRTDIACSTAKGYFYTQKIGAHWYFCDPLGNAFIAMSVGNLVTNSNPAFDCTRQAGTATGVTWSSGTATYTFSSLPSDAIAGNALVTTGFSPGGYNVTDAKIQSVGSNTVTVNISSTLGTATTIGSAAFDVNTFPIYTAKYGNDTYDWGWQTLNRLTGWGFNTVGQDAGAYVIASTTCSSCDWPGKTQPVPVPYINEMKPAENASINANNLITEPIKGMIVATNNNYTAYRGGELYDVFDPKLNTYMQAALLRNTDITSNYKYLLAIFTDDSDYFWGSGAGPDFISDHTNSNIAWITLITSPMQTFINSTPLGGDSFVYQTTEVYTKAQATNPSTPCSIANPCSLRDYLWQKYTNSPPSCATGAAAGIASLNQCWGSSYTTFDSTGVQVTAEQPSGWTGDGTTTTFTGTLAHSPLSPFSVLISVAGTAEAGDCPWFHCSGSTNTGKIESPTSGYLGTSTINYSTGAVRIVFSTAPASGVAITVNYVYNGWMSGGTGVMDENGANSGWVGTNSYCLEGADPNYPVYFSCTGGGGGTNPTVNANSNLGADLDNWVSQMAAEYFKTMQTDIRAVSNIPYFGLDVIGDYGTPAYSKFLEGAAPYLDGAFTGGIHYWEPLPSPTVTAVAYQYFSQYFGDKPFMTFGVLSAQSDSSYSCISDSGPADSATQSLRGNAYYNHVNYLLSTLSYNADIQFVGADWWSWQDFQGLDQGLVSLRDNAYDGNEAVIASVPCDSDYTSLVDCGGENVNYGNAISETNGIQAANALWLGIASKPTAPSKRSVIWGARKEQQKTVSCPSANRK